MDKEDVTNMYTMEYYSAMKKNERMLCEATRMQLEMIVLSEVRKRKTDTIWCHMCVEPKIRHKVNMSTTQKQTDKRREQTCDCPGGGV